MFMRANRTKNGAEQPEKTAASDAARQRSSRILAPNGDIPTGPDDWRFTPSMGTVAAINDDHYAGGISGSGPYGQSYEDKIPYIGFEEKPVNTDGTRTLKKGK